jgi:hypothetical protein
VSLPLHRSFRWLDRSARYHESTSSFAALATQSSMLSQSASALFDKDHPSMAGKGSHGITFRELKQDQIDAVRSKIGLREWDDEESMN